MNVRLLLKRFESSCIYQVFQINFIKQLIVSKKKYKFYKSKYFKKEIFYSSRIATNMTQNKNIFLIQQLGPSQKTCQQCEFMQSCKLSQQIVQLREKLLFYQNKNKEIQAFIEKDEQEKCKIVEDYQNVLEKYMECMDNDFENEVLRLQKQLQQLQKQLQKESPLQKTYEKEQQLLIQQFLEVQNYRFSKEKEYNQLAKELDQLSRKQAKLKPLKSLFQRTNFINIIYSISFEDNDSFLNGEKIVPQNSWKIVEILAFYQSKYRQYKSLVQIDWDRMQINPHEQKIQEQSQIDVIKSMPIQICCDYASNILQTWMKQIVLEMRNLFQFLVQQSGLKSKLKYQVTNQGQFQYVKSKFFKDQDQKFVIVIKCLLSDIDQINQLQFFAKQKRIKQHIEREG